MTLKTKDRVEFRSNVYIEFDEGTGTMQCIVNGNTAWTATATAAAFNSLLATIEDLSVATITDIALSTSDTYTDAAVNTAVNAAVQEINDELGVIETKVNAILARMEAVGISATA